MTARQDDATQVLLFFDKAVINITRMNFAIHTCFAHAACNQLGDLRAVI